MGWNILSPFLECINIQILCMQWQWCMKTSGHSFSVHGASSSLPLSQQGPDGLPMPGCWQKVSWTNTEWNVCHFEHGASCLQCEQNKVALKNDFQMLIQFKGIWRSRSDSLENRPRNWKCCKTEKQKCLCWILSSYSFFILAHFPLHSTSIYILRLDILWGACLYVTHNVKV